MNDKGLYTEVDGVIKPEVGKVYTVRDINDLGGFLLEEVKNSWLKSVFFIPTFMLLH